MKSSRIAALLSLLLIIFSITISNPNAPVHAQNSPAIIVTNTNDSGQGSFRNALEIATTGTQITFDPEVFPIDDPQTIWLINELPVIQHDGITIDASGAGVILDGELLDVNSNTYFDDIQFFINGELMISSDFTNGMNDWQPEDPNRTASWLLWEAEDGAETPGSLQSGNRPEGNHLIIYHDLIAGKEWFDFYAQDSSAWYHVQPGDRLELRYQFKGAQHNASFVYLDETQNDSSSFGDQWFTETSTWQSSILQATVPQDVSLIFPAFQTNNPNHGAGLSIASNHNAIYGLTIRNFNTGIVIEGSQNFIGSEIVASKTSCTGGCNHIVGNYRGIFTNGAENLITGNWISVQANDIIPDVWINGIVIGEGSINASVRGNYIGFEKTDNEDRVESGIYIQSGSLNSEIGPDNFIDGASQFGIAINSDNTVIYQNEIVSTGNCGIFVFESQGTVISNNWIGVGKDGEEAGNVFGVCLNTAQNTQLGPDNHIANNDFHGIDIGNSPQTQITSNSFYQNERGGIVIWDLVGDEPESPEITTVSYTTMTVIGNSEPYAMVEIFLDDENEGTQFAVSCEANSRGRFHCTIPRDQFQTDINVMAVALRTDGGTSTFSTPYTIKTPPYTFLVGITPPINILTNFNVVAISFWMAAALFILINLLAEIINGSLDTEESSTVEKNEKIEKHNSRGILTIEFGEKNFWFYLMWLIIVLGTAVAQSMLEDYPLFSRKQLQLTASLLLVTAILNLIEIGSEWLTRKHWKIGFQLNEKVKFGSLIIVILSVAFSRFLHFSPGIIIGIVGAVFFLPEFPENKQGKASFITLFSLLIFSGIALGVSYTFIGKLPFLEDLLKTLFFFGIQSVFFNLVPYPGSPGKDIKKWQQGWYWIFGLIVFIMFILMIFMPAFTDIDAMQKNDYVTLIVISAGLTFVAGFLWSVKKWKWFSKKN